MKVKDVLWILVLGGAAAFGYQVYESSKPDPKMLQVASAKAASSVSDVEDRSWIKPRDAEPGAAATPSWRCDGRTSCPQMTTCAEATYFIQHCPNTSMDGDHDGVPCEDQWCG